MKREISKILDESSIFTLREFGAFIGIANSSGVKKDVLINSIIEFLDSPPLEGSKKGRKHMVGLSELLDKLMKFDEFKPFEDKVCEYKKLEDDTKQLVKNYRKNTAVKETAVRDSVLVAIEDTSIKETASYEGEPKFVPMTKEISPDIPLFETGATAVISDIENKNTKPSQTECEGYLEVMPDKGFGFIRATGFDVYISGALIQKMCLKAGDFVKALYSERSPGKFAAYFIKGVNRKSVDDAFKRTPFETLRATFPTEKFNMVSSDNAVRAIDLFAPIGKGQRALIVSPPKSGKTTIIKNLASAIKAGNPETKIFILLIDERPEEVTDMQNADCGEVVFSAYDDKPDKHIKVATALLEKAKRLVENGDGVCILMDSLTRFARAINMSVTNNSRSLSGGMDAGALQTVKTFFGSGRNTVDGGSLTLIATALVDTNSKMDDLIFEEFKGTGNSEVVLDRSLSEKRIFPAIDIAKSGTRRDELMFSPVDYESVCHLRKYLSTKQRSAMENVIELFDKIKTNKELLERLPLLFKTMESKK